MIHVLLLAALSIAEALQPYVESGELPGAISIVSKDGVDEITCLGYADVAAKRPITIDDAFGTNCMVNYHKRQLKLWVVQLRGGPRPWDAAREAAENEFFKAEIDNSGANAYTGRVE